MVERKRFEWKLPSRTLQLGDSALVVGVLNITPDSFSDGGKYSDPDRAYARALEIEELGADVLDIGAESTRPGSTPVPEAEELRRLVPILKKLQGKLKIPISVDTYKAAVAEKAAGYGAEIINDPSGFTWDTNLAKTVSHHQMGFMLNHMRGTPQTWAKLGPIKDLIVTVRQDLEASISRALRAGVDKSRIVIDPGIGFGKRREQNAELLAHLGAFTTLGAPILIGPSRKQFLKQETERETEFATAAAVTAAILNGAHLVRVHDVAAMKAVVAVAEAIFRAGIVVAKDEEEKPKVPKGPLVDPGVNRMHSLANRPHESLSKRLRPSPSPNRGPNRRPPSR
ncbi:MAG TPA: dihydropteroate synthase [Bryobacteraceae bacterium]|jgi:dihydropteroate synthase